MSIATDVFQEIRGGLNLQYSLKPEQAKVLDFLIEKENVLAVLPTGFGKSLLYAVLPRIMNQVQFYHLVNNVVLANV